MANIINADSVEGLKITSDASNKIQFQADGINTFALDETSLSFPDGTIQKEALPAVGTKSQIVGSNGSKWVAGDAPSLVPNNLIMMFSGLVADIPKNWYLCDGSNGTPDLRDRFVAGAGGAYALANTGGNKSVTLKASNLPTHSHGGTTSVRVDFSGSTSGVGDHTHQIEDIAPTENMLIIAGGANRIGGWADTGAAGDHNHALSGTITDGSVTIAANGSNQPFGIVPPYYALSFIMYRRI